MPGVACVVQRCAPEGLVGVDVADARDEGLVEDRAFDARLPLPEPPRELVSVEQRIERVAGDVRDLGRKLGSVLAERHAAEDPLVREAELTTVVEGQGDAEMSRRIGIGLRDEELAAHSEMAQHGITTVELHPEILASPRGVYDRTSLEPVDEVRRSGQVA